MKTRLIHLWDGLRTSYWFVPGLLTSAAVALSLLTVHLDQHVQESWVRAVGWLWAGGPEGARDVLSTIASSMITVAGVTFSITIVALQLASSQFGPRVLRNFMSDTGNQVVLGTFVATFLYCLLVLRTVRSLDGRQFVPYISVTCGILLAVMSLGVLIYFVHHVSQSIRAEYLIAAVASDFNDALQRLFPDRWGSAEPGSEGEDAGLSEDALAERLSDAFPIKAEHSGYLQAIEPESLMQLAAAHDLVLRLPHRPGTFITEGDVLAQVWPEARCDDNLVTRLRATFILGRDRTPRQDIQYSVNQLVEIAVRALSPGINDPYTAAVCVDWLGASLSRFACRPMPPRCRYDEHGRLRIVAEITSLADLADVAFPPIRHYGRAGMMVMRRLLDALADIAGHVQSEEDRDALRAHAQLIERDSLEALSNPQDREIIEARYRKVLKALARREHETSQGDHERRAAAG